jgi:hypothetical protein
MASAKLDCVEFIHRLKFASVIQYTTDHDREAVESPNYFHSLSHRYVVPGDEIRVVITQGKSWLKTVFEVVSATPTETVVERLTAWREPGVPLAEPGDTPRRRRGTASLAVSAEE